MKVLITGCAGFLGSHLVEKFISYGYEVYGIDNLSTGNVNNLKHLKNNKLWKGMILRDITEKIEDLPDVDLILNFACAASPPAYQKDPVHTMMTCVVGTKHMLEHAHKNNAVFVQASTSEVYGDPLETPQQEEYRGNTNCYGYRSCYDIGKKAAESLCFDYLNKNNVDARVVRIFNTYGPNMDPNDGRVVSNFIKQAINNEDITIYGDGNQTRSFCYVDDLIEYIYRMSTLKTNPHTPINIGNPGEFTINELANKILELTNSKSKIIYCKLPSDDPTQRRPDITKAKNILCYEPKINLHEGLKRMIDFFKEKLIESQ